MLIRASGGMEEVGADKQGLTYVKSRIGEAEVRA